MFDKGYASQSVLDHDVVRKLSSKQFGGYCYTRFPTFTIPMLQQVVVASEDIRILTIDNPARILAY